MEGLTADMKFLAKEQKSIIPYLTKDEILLYKKLIAKHSVDRNNRSLIEPNFASMAEDWNSVSSVDGKKIFGKTAILLKAYWKSLLKSNTFRQTLQEHQ